MSMSKSLVAEFIGTFWLVLGGCGSAVLAATFISNGAMIGESTHFPLGIGLVGVSLAFGLTVVTMAYAIGHISGCHLNPAVSCGLVAAGRFPASQLVPYVIAQVLGAIVAAIILYIIASGDGSYGGLASNGYAAHSPGGYSVMAALVCEIVMTFVFLMVIIGATDKRAPAGFAPIAIGLCLTLIHLISIPVTNTSVNPARSTGPALVEMVTGIQNAAVGQLWLFWVAPIIGAILAGIVYKAVFETTEG
ncbi:MAG: aquaporin Z [Gammaproteobacteria bacterium]